MLAMMPSFECTVFIIPPGRALIILPAACHRKIFSRKKAAQRARRMAGQGLGPMAFKPDGSMPAAVPGKEPRSSRHSPGPHPSYGSRSSPSYEPEGGHRR